MTDNPSSTSNVSLAAQPTPVLSLRDVVVYPFMVSPLFVGRERSILALDKAMDVDKRIVLVTQRSADVDDPAESDLFEVAPWRRCCGCSVAGRLPRCGGSRTRHITHYLSEQLRSAMGIGAAGR
jgi:hypothetical protein